jgi:tRNA(Arg) A34 adenosine deaminase TadA
MEMKLLNLAAKIAFGSDRNKDYLLAAVVHRNDGAIVVSTNALTRKPMPLAHAEARVLRKADMGGMLYVARVLRTGEWALSKPCKTCQMLIRSKGIIRVYYTIGPDEYGVWDLKHSKEP